MPIATVFPEDGVFVQVGPHCVAGQGAASQCWQTLYRLAHLASGPDDSCHWRHFVAAGKPGRQIPTGFPDVKSLKLLIPDPKEVGEWLQGAREKFSELFGG